MANPVNRIRAIQTCRNWNEVFPPGTEVKFDGALRKTDTAAALGKKDEPVVFLEGIDEPIPISRLEVPGWVMATGRRNK